MNRVRGHGLIPVRLPDGRVFQLQEVIRDGEPAWLLRCPLCRTIGSIDADQFHGRVSTQCAQEGCSFHETLDFAAGATLD